MHEGLYYRMATKLNKIHHIIIHLPAKTSLNFKHFNQEVFFNIEKGEKTSLKKDSPR